MTGENNAVRQAAAAVERAVFAGEADDLGAAERGLTVLEADVALARAKLAHGRFLTGTGDAGEEPALLRRAVELYQQAGDVRGEAEALCWTGIYHQVVRQDGPAAVTALERARELAGDDLTRSYALRHLGFAEHQAGRLTAARELLEESTRLRRAAGFTAGVAANLVGLTYIAAAEDRRDDAFALMAEARAFAAESGARAILAQVDEAEKTLRD